MRWLGGLVAVFSFALLNVQMAYADSTLQLQPLSYTEALKKGERKKAFIDVTNPSSQSVNVQFSVQGFRQVDEEGSLTFFNDEKIKSGILLDHEEMEIPAKKTLRLFFIVDGTKLPAGDVFASIFAQTESIESAMVPSVRIGTLLILTNGTPSARNAEITSLTTPIFHFGNSISGVIKIKNTAPANTSSGFTPKVGVHAWPFGPTKTITAPLVFAGNTRTINFEIPSSQFGFYKVTASYESSYKDHWVFLVTGVWRWILTGVVLFVLAVTGYLFAFKKRRQRK